ncbi:putative DNA-binding transcriptional regulator [Vibrio nigripulchritudo MADA3029]|uniref:LysR family transcriptional regulator n=1 Tax=Vibrio nigripulchritudo TaxID=28173 RepID=UPI0003B200C6|nr:LysR family transcriptional regulator [Vibrio nigripulchritudo]CCN45104.1 putative DNA-binding transcriptional regulator [Vibrio nigripulchritudo MADA3020]CCN54442.1 putative DNA-binding transcriptional regulator [Vibrio nigripulchritudo MADA3021]CCN57492.1 putative DNA-binding transcriptional regulator [Vibrio nigripulchritudo MADA3029]
MKTHSDELEIFVSVVEHSSFSRAAAQLNVANSIVSRAIKKLEKKLGVVLLNRTTRRIGLTEEGRWFYEQSKSILQSMKDAETHLQNLKSTPSGMLNIDSSSPFMLHVIVPMVSSFSERYPDIQLNLSSNESLVNLLERKVDVAIRIGELEDSSIRARKIGETTRYLVASSEYLQKYGYPKTVEDLDKHKCLGFLHPNHLNDWPLENDGEASFCSQPTCKASSGEVIRQICLRGNGIACLSEFMVANDVLEGRLELVLTEHLKPNTMPIFAVYYGDQSISTRLRTFIDYLSEYFISMSTKMKCLHQQ